MNTRLAVHRQPGPLALAFALGCALLAIHRAADAQAPVRIALRGQVVVNRSAVVLADVADIDGDSTLAQRLKTLPLGHVAVDGEPVTMDRAALQRWIVACLSTGSDTFVLAGARQAQIHLATAHVGGDQIGRVAQDKMREALASSGLQVQVALVQTPADLAIPPGRLDLRVRPLPAARWAADVGNGKPIDAVLAKRQTVWVDVWVDDAFVRALPVSLELAAYGPAYVSARPLPAGRAVDAAHRDADGFSVETVDWTDRRSLPLAVGAASAPDDSLLLRRPLAAGQALQRGDVAQEALVVRGQPATLRSIDGDIELESQVEVLEDGMAGQRVRVRRPNTSAAIVAEVTGRRRVEIRE